MKQHLLIKLKEGGSKEERKAEGSAPEISTPLHPRQSPPWPPFSQHARSGNTCVGRDSWHAKRMQLSVLTSVLPHLAGALKPGARGGGGRRERSFLAIAA